MYLAYFANSEAMINENLASRFYKEILMPEAQMLYIYANA